VLGGVPGAKGFIENHPELEFFKRMPTVWDDTKVIEGQIGEYATIARKSGDEWFLGSLTGEQSHSPEINLSFLDAGATYEATIYSHDPESASSTKVKMGKMEVTSVSELRFEIAANSGLAIRFQKK
jgi:alpha-glucosidase